jgi:uncharacterized delta-60 repeat protein
VKTNYTAVILAMGLSISLSLSATAAPHDLDPTFGNGGKVITTGIGGISDIAIQPDGKIVAAGGARIVRYNANGSLDSLFGTGGIVVIQLGDNISFSVYSAAVQGDGKIVVVGGYNAAAGYGFAVVRCNPDGTLDTSFNGTGKIVTPDLDAWAVALQTDGKIVVVGGGRNTNQEEFSAVFRYHADGTPDTSFGGTGNINTPESSAHSVVIQPDGRIVVGGNIPYFEPGVYDPTIFRYNADGSPDTSFASTGRAVVFQSAAWGGVSNLAIQSDGKIVAKVSGWVESDFGDQPVTLMTGLNSNGSGAFGYIYESRNVFAGDLVIQPDGKIVSVSSSFNGSDFAVRRYNQYGLTDTTFNDVGLVTTDFGSQDDPFTAALQADGKIVVGGVTRTFEPSGNIIYHFALARYQGGSSSRTRFDFDGDGRADVSVFRPSDRVWYLNQSTNGFSATQFGLSTDKITPADYDGDGRTDISVYRDGTWYWLNSSDNSFSARQFGIASDIPVPADYYAGGGRSELAVYRNGTWWILNLYNDQVTTNQFGLATDIPVVGDYDGDGRADQAVYRNGEWHQNRSRHGYWVYQWGIATDKPVPEDYDGDGRTDLAVYRDGTWYLMQSLQGWLEIQWGIATDIPAPADYDGDGKTDPAVYRDGTWYLLRTTGGTSVQQFGLTDDKPVPSAYRP